MCNLAVPCLFSLQSGLPVLGHAISILVLILPALPWQYGHVHCPHFTPSPVISWWFAQVYDYCLLLVSLEKVELTIRTSYEDSYLLLLLVVILI